jgi:hypothetical protein
LPRTSKNNQYWTDEHEQLVKDYLNAGSKEERSVIYAKLRKPIRLMSEIILKRYSNINVRNLTYAEIQEYISDSEINLIEYSLPLFNAEKGRAYAFIGTSIRYYYRNYSLKILKHKEKYESIYDENNKIVHDAPVEQEDNNITDLHFKAIQKIKSIYEEIVNKLEIEELVKKEKKSDYIKNINTLKFSLALYEKLLKLFTEEKHLSRYYITYYLMKELNVKRFKLRTPLERYSMNKIICQNKDYSVDHFENLYALADKQLYPTIKDFLYNYRDNTPEHKILVRETEIRKTKRISEKLKERNEIKN